MTNIYREYYVDWLRHGYVIKSTLTNDQGMQTTRQAFIPDEDFDMIEHEGQETLIVQRFEKLEEELRALAHAG